MIVVGLIYLFAFLISAVLVLKSKNKTDKKERSGWLIQRLINPEGSRGEELESCKLANESFKANVPCTTAVGDLTNTHRPSESQEDHLMNLAVDAIVPYRPIEYPTSYRVDIDRETIV